MSGQKGLPFPKGSFVWTRFPFGPPDRPDRPGPVRHIAYVLGFREVSSGLQVLLAYTSSGPWRGRAGSPPLGVVEFSDAEAKALGQRAFHIDLRCLARLPPTAPWFPDIVASGQGVVGTAGARLQERLLRVADEAATRSPELIEVRGPR